ncbi:MAG: NUMOD4 motif-containing HNH endonuclease [Ferruginibacter sp.]
MNFAREEWKAINLGEGFTNDIRIEVSNFGRVKSYNKIKDGNLLKGSTVNGYKIIRVKLFNPRDPLTSKLFHGMQAETEVLSKKIVALKKLLANKLLDEAERNSLNQQLDTETHQLAEHKNSYNLLYQKDLKKRTTYFGGLVHRMVAEKFLKPGCPDQTIVAHIDHDKLNNKLYNLQWMNVQENSLHQQSSPHVIADKEKRQQGGIENGGYKLTTTKVMFLKKLINEGKPLRNLAKQFKITETQVIRIMREENWGSVKAAK